MQKSFLYLAAVSWIFLFALPSLIMGQSLSTPPLADQPPRLRTIFKNNAIALVERTPGASRIEICLTISSARTEDTVSTHGARHLLEHLISLGQNRNLDARLESIGGYLTARTLRDAMQFSVNVPQSAFQIGLDGLWEVMSAGEITNEQIQHEAKVIQHEGAVRDRSTIFSDAAWSAWFPNSLSPYGNPELISSFDRNSIKLLLRKMTTGRGLVVTVAGDIDLDMATQAIGAKVNALPETPPVLFELWPAAQPRRVNLETYGEARAVWVGKYDATKSVAALAAGLVIASQVEDSFLTYTPSIRQSVITVGRTEFSSGLGKWIDQIENPEAYYLAGVQLVKQWVQNQTRNPRNLTMTRGLLLSMGSDERPERILSALSRLSVSEFIEQFQRFQGDKAMILVGR